MIILLKIILGLIAAADALALRFVFRDFQVTRKQEGYDELSIWFRIRFNMVSFLVMASMISLFVFLVYFIIAKITIG